MTNRRTFLQPAATIAGSLILPKSLLARSPDRSVHFIHVDTQDSWPVADPVAWALDNVQDPILERASEGLRKLTANDGERIIRLVTRRCRLNFVELHPEQVVVHHWGRHRADLRPFFKAHGLARREVEVLVRDWRKETVTTLHGYNFLYSNLIAPDFDWQLFKTKWGRRFEQEGDDWSAVPGSFAGFAWDRLEDNRIPWAALKSAWRRVPPGSCLDCDKPTLLANFGLRPSGLFNRSPHFISVCGACQRSFRDESVKDVGAWIVANIDAEVQPDAEMIWGKRLKWDES